MSIKCFCVVDGRLTGSWGIMASAFRRSVRPIVDASTPSMIMEPDVGSTRRNKAVLQLLQHHIDISYLFITLPVMIELFPAPVLNQKFSVNITIRQELIYLPINPTFSLALISNEMPLRTAGSSGRYFITKSFNSTLPLAGQFGGGLWLGKLCGASCSIDCA